VCCISFIHNREENPLLSSFGLLKKKKKQKQEKKEENSSGYRRERKKRDHIFIFFVFDHPLTMAL
jgi:hypothetical protein